MNGRLPPRQPGCASDSDRGLPQTRVRRGHHQDGGWDNWSAARWQGAFLPLHGSPDHGGGCQTGNGDRIGVARGPFPAAHFLQLLGLAALSDYLVSCENSKLTNWVGIDWKALPARSCCWSECRTMSGSYATEIDRIVDA